MWGPRKECPLTWRQDIESEEYTIRVATKELNSATLTLANSAGAENRRQELRGRIDKARKAITKIEKKIAEHERVSHGR